jgi:hypothetical protein
MDLLVTKAIHRWKLFIAEGNEDEVLECDICGKTELKSTVILSFVDDETGDCEGEVYAGSSCASKLAGIPVRDINRQAKDADKAQRDAEDAARREAGRLAHEARYAGFSDWFERTYGVAGVGNEAKDLEGYKKLTGLRPFQLMMAFEGKADLQGNRLV